MAELNIPRSPRLTKANVDTFVRKDLDKILWHKTVLLAALRSRGKIKYNKGGQGDRIKWRPVYRYPTSTASGANPTSITFIRKNFRKEATLPWRHRNMGLSSTKFESVVNRGSAKFYDLKEEQIRLANKGFVDDVKRDLYTDGVANTDNMMGLQSWTGNTGSVTTGTPVLSPNDTYAELSTALGNYDGSWSPPSGKAWPIGQEGAGGGYCFWSPMGIDTNNSTYFTTDTFFENWQKIFNFADTHMENLHDERVDMWLLYPTYMEDLRNSLISIQTLEVTQNSPLTKMGYRTLTFLGTEITSESHVPANMGFGLNFEHLELWSALGQLVESVNDRDITTLEDLTALYSFLQLVTWTPACQVYLEEASSAGTHA